MRDFSLNRKFQSLVKQTLDSQKQTAVEVLKEKETVKNNEESAKSPDLFQDNNFRKKTSIKPYTTTRIKSRNFLLNISYVGISKEDFYNLNFLFDVYTLITKNLNPVLLEGKLGDPNGHEMIYALQKVHAG